MKLLPKKLIAASLATERKEAIDKGVAIAEKVDAVRETLAKEEKRLAEFRTLSVAHVQTEIDAKLREKNGIEREMLVRQEELKRLREPLDDEWDHVHHEQREIASTKATLLQKLHDLNEGMNLNIRRERLNKEEEQRIETLRHEADADRELATDAKKTGRHELASARKSASEILDLAKSREEAVSLREADAKERAAWVKQQEKKFTKWEKDLQDREEKLRVNQQVLIKSKAYINKQK